MENIQWLEFFRPFTALKYLGLNEDSAQSIVPALRHSQLAAGVVTQVLPAPQILSIGELLYNLQEL
jgi:hypothetical protein